MFKLAVSPSEPNGIAARLVKGEMPLALAFAAALAGVAIKVLAIVTVFAVLAVVVLSSNNSRSTCSGGGGGGGGGRQW